MNYLRLAIAIVFAVFAQCSFADSIQTFQITQVTMIMGPNDGSGDNLGFTLTGPGVTITGFGGMACFDWCSGPIPAPTGNPTEVFVSFFGSATIGGTAYDPMSLSLDCCLFNANGGVNASASGFVGEGDSFTQFNLILPTNGKWTLNFAFQPPESGNPGYYYFTDGEFSAQTRVTPEPGMVGLMLTGLAGIAGIVKRKTTVRRWSGRIVRR
ncbi:MAG: hypothetical protein DMG77_00650 [Acidobacteria bacterium]|nr:MAG: hypothetical protein DMG77_00650 [Acidobacteriota bacterium]